MVTTNGHSRFHNNAFTMWISSRGKTRGDTMWGQNLCFGETTKKSRRRRDEALVCQGRLWRRRNGQPQWRPSPRSPRFSVESSNSDHVRFHVDGALLVFNENGDGLLATPFTTWSFQRTNCIAPTKLVWSPWSTSQKAKKQVSCEKSDLFHIATSWWNIWLELLELVTRQRLARAKNQNNQTNQVRSSRNQTAFMMNERNTTFTTYINFTFLKSLFLKMYVVFRSHFTRTETCRMDKWLSKW